MLLLLLAFAFAPLPPPLPALAFEEENGWARGLQSQAACGYARGGGAPAGQVERKDAPALALPPP